MRALGYLLVLTACSDGGLVVRVDPNGIAIDEVRLYVGVGDGAATQLHPPQGLSYPSGDGVAYWTRDPSNVGDHAAITDLTQPARFVFVNDGSVTTLPAMIAIGYKDAVPVAAASRLDWSVPDEQFDVYTLTLTERITDPTLPPGPSANPFDFQVWSPSGDVPLTEAVCVGIQDNRPDPVFPSGFIVTKDDRDCDGVRDDDPRECDSDIYQSSRGPTRDELTCTVSASPTECFFGGPACVDGNPRDATECMPTKYCASSQLCEVCTGIACASDITPLVPDNLPFHIACVFHTMPDGTFCDSVTIPSLPMTVGCTDAAIRTVAQGFGDEIAHDTMKLTLERGGPLGCDMTLAPSGVADVGLDGEVEFGALLAVDLDNGRGVAVPIYVHVKAGCGTPSVCAFQNLNTDSPAACAGL